VKRFIEGVGVILGRGKRLNQKEAGSKQYKVKSIQSEGDEYTAEVNKNVSLSASDLLYSY